MKDNTFCWFCIIQELINKPEIKKLLVQFFNWSRQSWVIKCQLFYVINKGKTTTNERKYLLWILYTTWILLYNRNFSIDQGKAEWLNANYYVLRINEKLLQMKENINKEMNQKSEIALSIVHDIVKYRTSY